LTRPFQFTRLASGLLAVAIGAALAAEGGSPITTEPVARVLLASLFFVAGGRALLADAQIATAFGARVERPVPGTGVHRTVFLPLGVVLLILGVWQGLAAVEARGWPLLWLGMATVLIAVAYSRGPALRDRGLGEVTSFFLFGPLPVLAGFHAASGRLSGAAVAASLPLGLLATACFVAAAREPELGEAGGPAETRRGWTADFSRRGLERVFLVLIAASYAWVCFGAVRGFYPLYALAVLITIPWSARAFAALRRAPAADAASFGRAADGAVTAYLTFAAVLLGALLLHVATGSRAI
jgi:1,4-dihydroxy-2-naphthoate octaprenyltransferase